jgi:hypothetical protein
MSVQNDLDKEKEAKEKGRLNRLSKLPYFTFF